MARSKYAKRISELITRGECSNGDFETLQVILGGLDTILLEMIEPLERRVFDWIVDGDLSTTSNAVSKQFNIKMNHAGTILGNLCDLCLLDRREVRDAHGKFYIYTAHGDWGSA